MLVKNITKKTILSVEAIMCDTVFSRFLGLMFAKKPKTLIFRFEKKQKISLHMFFVFFPIDVVFLDEKKKVVDMKENFRPFTLYNSKEAVYAMEFPAGTIKRTKTATRDVIDFNG